jgi:hypothetical protein
MKNPFRHIYSEGKIRANVREYVPIGIVLLFQRFNILINIIFCVQKNTLKRSFNSFFSRGYLSHLDYHILQCLIYDNIMLLLRKHTALELIRFYLRFTWFHK